MALQHCIFALFRVLLAVSLLYIIARAHRRNADFPVYTFFVAHSRPIIYSIASHYSLGLLPTRPRSF